MIQKEKNRGTEATFMTKELNKAIMNRSKLKNRYTNRPSCENLSAISARIFTKSQKITTFLKLFQMEYWEINNFGIQSNLF